MKAMSLRYLRYAVQAFAFCAIACGFSAAARADITSNLAVYYKFDSLSGTSATDSSGNGNTGTLSNATFVPNGKYFGAYSSTNTSSTVTVASSASLSMTSFTIATWAYFKGVSAQQYFAERGVTTASNNYYFYWTTGTGYVCGFYDGTGYRQLIVSGTPTTNTWSHFACSFNNTTKVMTMYKDGVSIGTTTLNYTPVTAASAMQVGRSGDNTGASFTGFMDEFRLYSRALTADDIGELYRTPIWATTCGSPTGNAGDIIYDTTTRKAAYCNATQWVQIGAGPKGGGGCTNPVKTAGTIIFDSANRVMKHCNGQEWATWGVVGGIGSGSGCASPTGVGGSIVFNADYRVLQYCDGKTWQMIGGYQPTVSLDFLNNKYTVNGTIYTDFPTFMTAMGGVTYRSTIGTYFDSSGIMRTAAPDTPRIDYDPVTHAPKGLLTESYSVNLLKRSDALNNASWSKNGVTVSANVTTAPDGTSGAESVSPTGAALSYIDQTATWAAGTTMTRSIYAKAGNSSTVVFEQLVAGANTDAAEFNVSSCTVTYTGPGITASTQSVGNGWCRLIATRYFAGASGASNRFGVIYIDTYGTGYAGNNVYLWGAQLEARATVSSYIPTVAATVMRTAEDIRMPIGTWFNGTNGTLWAQAIIPYLGTGNWPGPASLSGATANDALDLFLVDLPPYQESTEIYNGGSQTYSYAGTNYTAGKVFREALVYSSNYIASATDGSGDAPYSATIPSFTTLNIGSSNGNNYPLNGWTQGIKYYPFTLKNTIIQTITQK